MKIVHLINPVKRPCALLTFVVLMSVAAGPYARAQYTHTLTINPVRLAQSSGALVIGESTWTNFTAATSKIWAQADIHINWLPLQTITSNTTYAAIGSTTLFNISQFYAPYLWSTGDDEVFSAATVGRNETDGVLNLWIVGALSGIGGKAATSTPYGLAISQNVISGGFFGTIAHEIGHSLLRNNAHTADPKSLMYSNPAVVSLGNIYPDGVGYFTLTAGEIAVAKASPLLAPYSQPPSTVPDALPTGAALVFGFSLLWFHRRFVG